MENADAVHPALSGVEPSSLGTRTPLHIDKAPGLKWAPALWGGKAESNRPHGRARTYHRACLQMPRVFPLPELPRVTAGQLDLSEPPAGQEGALFWCAAI